jgi:hypothetical protein
MRRPLPALIALLALLLLTALVWWRVLNRDNGGSTASGCPTETAAAATLPAPSLITLDVLNATDRNGIASKARTTLVADGFNVPNPAGNDKPKVRVRGVAEIRYGPTGRAAAELVHYYFPGARMVANNSKSAIVVISLGERYRGVASPSSVQAALKRKQIALDTTTPGAPSPSPSC